MVWRFGRSQQKGQENWKVLDAAIAKGGAATLYGPAEQVGGVKSWFTTGKHVVVCLAIGTEMFENKMREFHIVFDPDVRATEVSQALWAELIAKHVPPDASLSDVEPKTRYLVLHTMIFGQGNDRFGPVVRKYYPDKQRLLGKMGRKIFRSCSRGRRTVSIATRTSAPRRRARTGCPAPTASVRPEQRSVQRPARKRQAQPRGRGVEALASAWARSPVPTMRLPKRGS